MVLVEAVEIALSCLLFLTVSSTLPWGHKENGYELYPQRTPILSHVLFALLPITLTLVALCLEQMV